MTRYSETVLRVQWFGIKIILKKKKKKKKLFRHKFQPEVPDFKSNSSGMLVHGYLLSSGWTTRAHLEGQNGGGHEESLRENK